MAVSDSIIDFFALALAVFTLFYECSMPISLLVLDVLASAVQTAILYSSPDPARVLRALRDPSKLLAAIPRPSDLLGPRFLSGIEPGKKVQFNSSGTPIAQQLPLDAAKELSQTLPEVNKVLLPVSTLTNWIEVDKSKLTNGSSDILLPVSTSNPSSAIKVNESKLTNGILDLSEAAPKVHLNGSILQSKSRESDGSDLVESESTLRVTCDLSDMGNTSSTHVYNPNEKTPSTIFETKCHPEVEDVCARVDGYFLDHWPFPTQQDKDNYKASDLCRWACYALPGSTSDRVDDACKVNILLFLLDDVAENMSVEEGKAFYQKLVPLAMGTAQPNRSDPVEWITYDIWASMRAIDEGRTQDVFQTALLCIMAQVDSARNSCADIGSLLRQREKEGGCGFVEAVCRWSMCLTIDPDVYKSFRPLLALYAKHGVTVNDIESYQKEVNAWNKEHKEGARVLNIVHLLSNDTGLMPEASKRVLWTLSREWELDFFRMVDEYSNEPSLKGNEDVEKFFKGLEWILAGNEHWSLYTARYHGSAKA